MVITDLELHARLLRELNPKPRHGPLGQVRGQRRLPLKEPEIRVLYLAELALSSAYQQSWPKIPSVTGAETHS